MLVKFIEAFRYLVFAMAADQLLPTGCKCSIAFFFGNSVYGNSVYVSVFNCIFFFLAILFP